MDNNNKDIVIEDAFKRLEEIATSLENPEVKLKDSLALYAEGVELVSACKENLTGIEQQIKVLTEVNG